MLVRHVTQEKGCGARSCNFFGCDAVAHGTCTGSMVACCYEMLMQPLADQNKLPIMTDGMMFVETLTQEAYYPVA